MAMTEQKQGNFVACTDDKPQTGNWFTAIYEDDYDGLLIAMCNQNGRYPHHVTALLNGLDGKRQSMDTISRIEAENRDLRAKLETVEAETRERLSNMLDPEIGFPSDDLLRCIHADVEMRGRKNEAFAVTVHHRNIMLSAVAAAIRNLDPRHD